MANKKPPRSKSKEKKNPTRAGRYGPGFAGNPWRNKAGQFTSKDRDANGKPYS